MIKTILVLTDEAPGFQATLALAIDLGRRLDAHLEVLHVRADPTALLPIAGEEISPAVLEEMRRAAEKTIENRQSKARAIYDRLRAETQAPMSWRVAIGEEPDIAAAVGRLNDLIVIGRPSASDDNQWRTTVDAMLFESGRPVLRLARTSAPRLGERVALAWNGSAQATHAVAAALPVLRLADQVTILTAGAIDPYASTAGLIAYLGRHDVQAVAREFEPSHMPVGQALLAQTKLSHSDLLVMGAYSHSRLREVILGGATREVLADADLPVLMTH